MAQITEIMKILILIFIPFNLLGQIWIDTIPDYDHKDISKNKINYFGEWRHMDKPDQHGSYPKSQDAYLEYKFWGFGIDIYTEQFPHHNYYIVELDGIKDTVKIDGSKNRYNYRTYFNQRLSYGNHTLKIYGLNYVINYLVKYVDSNPYKIPFWADSLLCDTSPCDTVVIKDTIFLQPKIYISADSLIYELK